MSNNFDTSSTGVNLELSWHYDSFLSQLNFTGTLEQLETETNYLIYFPGYQEKLWGLSADEGQKDPASLDNYLAYTSEIVSLLEAEWGKEEVQEDACEYYNDIYAKEGDKLPLLAMDTCDLKSLLEELIERDYGASDAVVFYREHFLPLYEVIGVSGYSQGDFLEVVVSAEYYQENKEWIDGDFLQHVCFSSYITAHLIVDQDADYEVNLGGYDADTLRDDFLRDVVQMHMNHKKIPYIVEWVREQVKNDPKHD